MLNIVAKTSIIVIFLSCTALTANGEGIAKDINRIEQDSTTKNIEKPKTKTKAEYSYWHPIPKKAMWMSVMCPGLGQIYNRSYWKVPIIYGGVAAFSYLISWQGRMYNDYSNAYYDIMDNDPNTKSYESIFKNLDGTLDWKQKTLKNKRDSYRKNRDLCIFGVALLYVLNVLDAFVDGHLYDFSVTDDLSLRTEPILQYQGLGYFDTEMPSNHATMIGLKCSLKF